MSKIHQLTAGLFRDTMEEKLLLNKATYHGQAHFGGTGRWTSNGPSDAKCSKHREFTMDRKGPAFPHNAYSCKHFVEASEPQPLVRPL
jgi:hypothetical protein